MLNLKDIIVGQYIPGQSFVHRLDPRSKVILAVIYVASVFVIRSYTGFVLMTAFTLALIRLATVPLRYLYRGIRPMRSIVILIFLFQLFFYPGDVVLFRWGKLVIYEAGLHEGIYMAFRLVLVVVFTTLLTLTTSAVALTDAIENLLRPFRRVGLRSHEIALLTTIALRFVPTLIDQADKIKKAQMARGADFETGNLLQRARKMFPLFMPLFLNTFRRADDLGLAMEARCYGGTVQRTRYREMAMGGRDAVAFAFTAVFLAAMVILGL